MAINSEAIRFLLIHGAQLHPPLVHRCPETIELMVENV
jgi:hypothetical protein